MGKTQADLLREAMRNQKSYAEVVREQEETVEPVELPVHVVQDGQKAAEDIFVWGKQTLLLDWAKNIPITLPDISGVPEKYTDLIPDLDTVAEHYEFVPEQLSNMVLAYTTLQLLLATGEPGTGKTTLPEIFAAFLGIPFHRYNFTDQMDIQELTFARDFGVDGDGNPITQYTLAHLGDAMQYPGVYLADEFFAAPSEVGNGIRTIMDTGKLHMPDGSVIERHPQFFLMFADNTTGGGDDFDKYKRTSQDASLRNRINMVVPFDYLPEKKEVNILTSVAPNLSEGDATILVQLAGLTRRSFREGDMSVPMTLRNLRAIAENYEYTRDVKYCVMLCFGNSLGSDEDRTVFWGHARTVGLNLD